MNNKPSNFWKELKRRKVFRVIAMYAAAAYVIIELSNNIVEPLSLPGWVPTLIIVLLVIGFPFAVIFSWIFDVTTEGIKKTESAKAVKEKENDKSPAKRTLRVSDFIIAVLLVAVIVLAWPRIFRKDTLRNIRDADGKISMAVMPFKNMTGDTTYNNWQDSFQYLLIGNLSNTLTDELSVIQYETMVEITRGTDQLNYAGLTPKAASEMARKLNANTLVNGSFSKAGEKFRISIQLLESGSSEIYKSFTMECEQEDAFFNIVDSLALLIEDYFRIEKLRQDMAPDQFLTVNTSSFEAYSYMVQAWKMVANYNWRAALENFEKALEMDPDLIVADLGLVLGYYMTGEYQQSRMILEKLDHAPGKIAYRDQLLIDHIRSGYLEKNPEKGLQYAMQLHEMEPENRWFLNNIGDLNRLLHNWDQVIEAYEQYIALDEKWGMNERWIAPYGELGDAYHHTGNHKREQEIYQMVLDRFPESAYIIYRQARCALSRGDTTGAKRHIEDYVRFRDENNGWSPTWIFNSLARLHSEAGILDAAERYYRRALDLQPENPSLKNNLAWFLIDHDVDVEEGLRLVEQALDAVPENPYFMHTRGWGLYRTGRPEDALALLERSWDLRPTYDHDHYLNIQEVREALASRSQ
jgi:tetratricopeptide (TPR) repeat protein